MEQQIRQTNKKGLQIAGIIISILQIISTIVIFEYRFLDKLFSSEEAIMPGIIALFILYPSLILWPFGLITGVILLMRKKRFFGFFALFSALLLLTVQLLFFWLCPTIGPRSFTCSPY